MLRSLKKWLPVLLVLGLSRDAAVFHINVQPSNFIYVKAVQNDGFDNDSGEFRSTLSSLKPHEETNEHEDDLREVRSVHLDHNLGSDKIENGNTGDQNHTAPMFKKINKMHSSIVKPVGIFLRLRCPSIGNPRPNITWLKNNAEPKRANGLIAMTKWTLRIEDLELKDSGNYTCIVCNYLACIDHTFQVEVVESFSHKPYINVGFPMNVTAVVDSTATFSCPIFSDLEPYIYWVKVADHPDNEKDSPHGTLIQEGVGANPEVLTLYNVTKEDEGWYTCIAQTTMGASFSSAYLEVVDDFTSTTESSSSISYSPDVS